MSLNSFDLLPQTTIMFSSFFIMPTRDLTSSLPFLVLSFSALPGLDHLAVLQTRRCSQFSWLSHGSHQTTLGWSLPPLSRCFCVLPRMFSSRFFVWCSVLSNFWIRLSPFLCQPFVTLPMMLLLFIRLLIFCAFVLLDFVSTSILDSSPIEFCCVGISATARRPSICVLPLLTAGVAAFIARLGGLARLSTLVVLPTLLLCSKTLKEKNLTDSTMLLREREKMCRVYLKLCAYTCERPVLTVQRVWLAKPLWNRTAHHNQQKRLREKLLDATCASLAPWQDLISVASNVLSSCWSFRQRENDAV